jgi:hypothetical protein
MGSQLESISLVGHVHARLERVEPTVFWVGIIDIPSVHISNQFSSLIVIDRRPATGR